MSEFLQIIELLGVFTGVIYVLGALYEKKWCWPAGIISSICTILISWAALYYQDAFLNFYYVIAGIYGWYMWSSSNKQSTIPIRRTTMKILVLYLAGGVLLSAISGFIFQQLGNDKSYLDAFTTIFSFLATWMVARKEIENWLIWIVVDAVAAYMYWYKGYEFYSGLFIFYALISIGGYVVWRKKLQKSSAK